MPAPHHHHHHHHHHHQLWPKTVENVQTLPLAGFARLFCQHLNATEVLFCLGYLTEILGAKEPKKGWLVVCCMCLVPCRHRHRSFVMSQKQIVRDATDTDCRIQNGSAQGRILAIFERRFLTNQISINLLGVKTRL